MLNFVVLPVCVNMICIVRVLARTGKMGKHFPVRENYTKYWETQGISDKCYLLVIFKWTAHYVLDWIKFSVYKKMFKKYWKKAGGGEYMKSREILVIPEKWQLWLPVCVNIICSVCRLKLEQGFQSITFKFVLFCFRNITVPGRLPKLRSIRWPWRWLRFGWLLRQ